MGAKMCGSKLNGIFQNRFSGKFDQLLPHDGPFMQTNEHELQFIYCIYIICISYHTHFYIDLIMQINRTQTKYE